MSQASERAANWLDDEAPLTSAMMGEIRRLARRARRRRWQTALLAAVFFALPAYVIWLRKPPQRAVISLSFVPRNGLGYANREVRAYVESVLLSRENMYGLIKRLELVGNLERRDLDTVVEMVRGRIEVEAYQQMALADALGVQAPGARVRISIVHADAAIAARLADGLLQLITETEHARRSEQARQTRERAAAQQGILAAQRADLVARLAAIEPRRAAAAAASVEGRQLVLDEAMLREQLERIDGLADDMARVASLRAFATSIAADTASDLEVLDVQRPNVGQKNRVELQVGLSMIALLACLGVAGALVAAFDRRIDAPEDLLRLGTMGLGTWRPPA